MEIICIRSSTVFPLPKFCMPLRKLEIINSDLGFVFLYVKMDRVAEDLKFAFVLKFVSKRPSIYVL